MRSSKIIMMMRIISQTQRSSAAELEGGTRNGMVGHQSSLSLLFPLNPYLHFQIPWEKTRIGLIWMGPNNSNGMVILHREREKDRVTSFGLCHRPL